jgi:glycosyltransferase involved in cell wall biosynthesis
MNGWQDKFIVAVVSRLTGQKGVHLIKHAAFRALERGGQFVLLGSAPDPKVQADFEALAGTMPQQDAAFAFKYDEPLSHLIYAAADMIVVPSMFEPCGLTQVSGGWWSRGGGGEEAAGADALRVVASTHGGANVLQCLRLQRCTLARPWLHHLHTLAKPHPH